MSLVPEGELLSQGVSPNGDVIAYIPQFLYPLMLHIKNVDSGSEATSLIDHPDIEEEQAGLISWSPNGRYLAFITFQDDLFSEFINTLDIKTMEITTYLTDKLIHYEILGWPGDNRVLVRNLTGNGQYEINAETLTVESVSTSTP